MSSPLVIPNSRLWMSLQHPTCALHHKDLEIKLRPMGRGRSRAHVELQLGNVGWPRGAELRHQGPRLGGASSLCLQRVLGWSWERGREG